MLEHLNVYHNIERLLQLFYYYFNANTLASIHLIKN